MCETQTEERYFTDPSIIVQTAAMVQKEGENMTNGIVITVDCPAGFDAVELVLEYSEIKAALKALKADRRAMPHLYTSTNIPVMEGANV